MKRKQAFLFLEASPTELVINHVKNCGATGDVLKGIWCDSDLEHDKEKHLKSYLK
jgi:hypothetical protein